MSTRTSVKFGTILSNLIRDRMPYFEEAFTEVSSQYLLYGYRKPISTAYHGYILVQASRTQGRFSMEVGLTRGPSFPYHRLGDHPDIALVGYREAVFNLLKGYNHSDEYVNAESLFRSLYSLLKDAEMALSRLMERCITRIQTSYDEWQNLYNQWLELERDASGPPGQRYPSLSAEGFAFEVIESMLTQGLYDRYLGPLKYRYRNVNFMNCHVYMLARGLEFIEPPEPPVTPLFTDPPASLKLAVALDDPISALTGRLPQRYCVELPSAMSSKTTQFAFLKSLSAVEALLQIDEAGNPIGANGFQTFGQGAAAELLDAPDYTDYSALNKSNSVAQAAPPPAPAPEKPGQVQRVEPKIPHKPIFSVEDGDDPIAMLENRLGLR